jgi:hypothetical protein
MPDIFNGGGIRDQTRCESVPTHGLSMRLVFLWAVNRKSSGLRDEMVELNGIEPSACRSDRSLFGVVNQKGYNIPFSLNSNLPFIDLKYFSLKAASDRVVHSS